MKSLSSIAMVITIFFMVQVSCELQGMQEYEEGNYTEALEGGTIVITAVNRELNKEQRKIVCNFFGLRPEPVLKPERKIKPVFRSKPTRQPVLNKEYIWGIVEYSESEKLYHAKLLLEFKANNK